MSLCGTSAAEVNFTAFQIYSLHTPLLPFNSFHHSLHPTAHEDLSCLQQIISFLFSGILTYLKINTMSIPSLCFCRLSLCCPSASLVQSSLCVCGWCTFLSAEPQYYVAMHFQRDHLLWTCVSLVAFRQGLYSRFKTW